MIYVTRNGVLHIFFGSAEYSETIKLHQGDLLSEILAKESAAKATISRSGLLQLGTNTP